MSDPDAALPDWEQLSDHDGTGIPLLGTALLIASDEYPQEDLARHQRQLQAHVEHLQDVVSAIGHDALKMQAINQHLFDELGYAGNHDDYYDPRNSYLNEVLDRRLGNPISLALVQMEVCRRLGLPLDGVSFPGHFLVRLPVDDGVLVMDPFNRGRPLDVDELRQRAQPHLGGGTPDDDALSRILHPASHRAILVRILRNLHAIYREREDWPRALRSADRALKLLPGDPGGLRDRGLAYLELGHAIGAHRDLLRYLELQPAAEDAVQVRERLLASGVHAPRLQ